MPAPSYVSEPQVQYLHQVLDQIAKGDLLIPDFQRPNRWSDDQRRELLGSISRGYPIGALMVWRTTKILATAKAVGDRVPPQASSSPVRQYLLDGMQRMSTLFAALWSPARGDQDLPEFQPRPPDGARWRLGYHLTQEEWIFMQEAEESESSLVVSGRSLLRVVDLIRFQRGLKHADADMLVERADRLANAIREYKIAIVPLVGDSVVDAAKTFTLLNSQGTPMSDLDLIHALTWSDNFNLRTLLDRAKAALHPIGWSEFDEKYFLAVIRGALNLDLYSGAPEEVSEGIKADPEVIDRVVTALLATAVFLRDDCDVVTRELLPYSYQAVLLADIFYRHPEPSKELRHQLVQWFWWTTAWATFAGISGYRLTGMVRYLRDVAAEKTVRWPRKRVEATPLPATIRPDSARIRALAIHLFRVQGCPDRLRWRLERDGANALIRAIGDSRSPGNAFLVAEEEEAAFQRTLEPPERHPLFAALQRHPISEDPGLRKAHVISERAWELLGEGNHEGFIAERVTALERLEERFLDELGKPPGC